MEQGVMEPICAHQNRCDGTHLCTSEQVRWNPSVHIRTGAMEPICAHQNRCDGTHLCTSEQVRWNPSVHIRTGAMEPICAHQNRCDGTHLCTSEQVRWNPSVHIRTGAMEPICAHQNRCDGTHLCTSEQAPAAATLQAPDRAGLSEQPPLEMCVQDLGATVHLRLQDRASTGHHLSIQGLQFSPGLLPQRKASQVMKTKENQAAALGYTLTFWGGNQKLSHPGVRRIRQITLSAVGNPRGKPGEANVLSKLTSDSR
ncbi:hypothetical protein P7K49_014952 [Saguinus oedipus]|uniref:Uncharacterized protein n=1 Tax=Saguinus oedipus TaxID=9490 RepID=A0ABQ9V7V4_SAGOE|nr:hypothetical protein P7K49_014952 [Saguinus oedipus]